MHVLSHQTGPLYEFIVDRVNVGIFVLNEQMQIVLWNRFMEIHSRRKADSAMAQNLFDLFPELPRRRLERKIKNVFLLKNFAFTSWEQLPYLFRFPHNRPVTGGIDCMRQNCTMLPVKDPTGNVQYVCYMLFDVTDTSIYQTMLHETMGKLQEASDRDGLTGIFNRRYIETSLATALGRAQRYGERLALILIDIDHFKQGNDQHGHLAGDATIRRVCQVLGAGLRTADLLGRYGVTTVPRERLLKRLGTLLDNERVLGYVVIAPALLLLLVLVAYPFCIAVSLSVQDKVIGKPGIFVGLGNFVTLLSSQVFRQTLQNSFVFTIVSVTCKVVLGMALALLLNRSIRAKNFFRGAVLLPWIVPTALSTLAFLWIFDATYSIINWVLLRLGIIDQGILWLGKPYLAMLSVIFVNTWRGMPFFAISLLAGLVSIPQELYEAAKTDGAGPVAQFWYITLPMVKPVLMIVILFSTIFTFGDFNIVYVLTRGGPVNSTHLFATYAQQTGLMSARIGEGAAVSLFLFPILVVVIFLQLRFLRRQEY